MTAKRIFFALLIAGVIATLVTVLGAQSSLITASSPVQHLYGSWIFEVMTDGYPPHIELVTFTTYGGYAASANDPDVSTSHGAWARTRDRKFAYTFMRFWFNFVLWPGQQPFTATSKCQGTLTLNKKSDELSGPFRAEVFDPAGNLLFSASGTVKGKHIVVEPLQ